MRRPKYFFSSICTALPCASRLILGVLLERVEDLLDDEGPLEPGGQIESRPIREGIELVEG